MPEPEPEDELLSYWTAIGLEPTVEERYNQLEQDILALEQEYAEMAQEAGQQNPEKVLQLGQRVKAARAAFNGLRGERAAT